MVQRTCSVDDCDRPHKAKGLCRKHYDIEYRRNLNSDYYKRVYARTKADPDRMERVRERQRERTRRLRGSTREYQGICRTCGAELPRYQVFCSKKCSRVADKERYARDPAERARVARNHRRRKARLRGRRTEPYDRTTVFERDDWICGLCGKRINRDASWPDPDAGSIDHILPISEGGDDVLANVQAAHFHCNWTKGNRPRTEQLRLIG